MKDPGILARWKKAVFLWNNSMKTSFPDGFTTYPYISLQNSRPRCLKDFSIIPYDNAERRIELTCLYDLGGCLAHLRDELGSFENQSPIPLHSLLPLLLSQSHGLKSFVCC